MLYISYRGIYDGTNYEYANTPEQLGKAISRGYTCMIDVWKVQEKFYLGNDQPLIEVSEKYIQGKKWYINARNIEMQDWLDLQPISLYPSWFFFQSSTPPPDFAEASNGKLITPGTVPINNDSIIFLPEIDDKGLFSTVHLKCFGICSTYLSFISRMRNTGTWY